MSPKAIARDFKGLLKEAVKNSKPEISRILYFRDNDQRRLPNFNPFVHCKDNATCQNIDINLVCSSKTRECECRNDMKWNEDELECQVCDPRVLVEQGIYHIAIIDRATCNQELLHLYLYFADIF